MGTNVSFVCRPSKVNRLGTAPIELCVNTDGNRKYIQLKLRAKPEEYKAALAGKGYTHILEYIAACRTKVDKIIVELTKDNLPITAERIKYGFVHTDKEYTLGNLFAEFISMAKDRQGVQITNDTYRRYVNTTKTFMEANKVDENFLAKDITLQHFNTYRTWLLKQIEVSTARNYLQKIKSAFKFAFETGKIPANPFYGQRIDQGIKDTVLYLTTEEIEMIKSHKFNDRLQRIADVFLFSCYTGLSYKDISELTPEDFIEERGYTCVSKKRAKTGIKFFTVLFDPAKEIADKYDRKLPVKSNAKTNAYLKEIGTICGIEKELHFHMARHTAACYFINHRPALPNETIQRIFGWTNDKQLHHYAKIFNTTVLADIENAFGEQKEQKKKQPEKKQDRFQKFLDTIAPIL